MKRLLYLFLSIISVVALQSCDDRDDIRADIDSLNARLDALEPLIQQYNEDIANYQAILNGHVLVVGYTELKNDDGNTYAYVVDLSNGEQITVYNGKPDESLPVMSIGSDGYWYYTQDGITQQLLDGSGKPVSASPTDGRTPQFRVNSASGEWEYSLDGGTTWQGGLGIANPEMGQAGMSIFSDVKVEGENMVFEWEDDESATHTVKVPLYGGLSLKIETEEDPVTFGLGQTKKFTVTQGEGVTEAVIETTGWGIKLTETELTVTAPAANSQGKDYETQIAIKIFSKEGYCRLVTLPVKLLATAVNENSAIAWQNFLSGGSENVLLDYSYAGYMHGEVAPPDVNGLGYTVYNVMDYGAVKGTEPGNSLANRAALEAIKKEISNGGAKASANAIVYFPEGDFVLHSESDNVDGLTETIMFNYGNFVLKGAGRDKTRLIMHDESLPKNESEMWSCPPMIQIKNNAGLSCIAAVTGDVVEKGGFSVGVSSTSGLNVGDWVCLSVKNSDAEFVAQELAPHSKDDLVGNAEIASATGGVVVNEYHQIKSVSGGKVEFHEPIMHEVDPRWGWTIQKYPHYENVGIEDMTFVGNAKPDFYHHGSAKDDSGFDPINVMRVTNSWIRRVNFESVSEAFSFVNSANCSGYDIHIGGNRGHAAVRSQASSRIFIGKVTDESSGPLAYKGNQRPTGTSVAGAGQYHACGVNKESIGTVIWNVDWGTDACFESHASQPRATLIDCSTGGFMTYRQGGDQTQLPNHLDDLTLWNFNSKNSWPCYFGGESTFIWWNSTDVWWRFLPPVIVGFHGGSVGFDDSPEQVKHLESNGTPVEPYSLYEAQLEKRLGYVPAWLNAIK